MGIISGCRGRLSSLVGLVRSLWLSGAGGWEGRFGLRPTALALAVAAELFSYFLNAYVTINQPHSYARFIDIAEAPFGPIDGRALHFPEYRMRVLGPALAYLLGLHGKPGTVIPLLGSVPFYYCAYLAMRRRAPAGTAAATVFLLATTLVTMSSRMMLGFQDTLVCLFIMLCIYYRNPVVLSASMFLGMFADERAASAVPLILLWHLLELRGEGLAWPGAVALRGAGLASAVACWALARSYLMRRLQIESFPQVEAALSGTVVREQADALHLGYYFGLRAAWLLPIALLWEWARSHRVLALAYALAVSPVLLAASLAFDISRIAALAYPAVLIAVAELGRAKPVECAAYLKSALLLNVFSPAGWMMGHRGFNWRPGDPFLFKVVRRLASLLRSLTVG